MVSAGHDRRPATPAKPPLKRRLTALFREYGLIAILTHATISILTISGLSFAIWIGVSPSSATGVLGVIAAGWAAAQPTLPVRTLITLALTPVVARLISRRHRARHRAASAAAPGAVTPAADAPQP